MANWRATHKQYALKLRKMLKPQFYVHNGNETEKEEAADVEGLFSVDGQNVQ